MKKNLLVSLVLLMCVIGFDNVSKACTNLLITKGATKDGSSMIAYTADSHVLYGELYYLAGKDHPEGAMRDVYEWDTGEFLGKIKEVRHTYTRVGNINENQVSIGETTYGGLDSLLHQPGATMDYGSMMYIALERATTAREAIQIMTNLVAEHGYISEGESFSIADPNEVWIMEMIGKGKYEKGAVWVAVRIPDGYISGHANQARIRQFPLNDPENCLYSKDVISFAKKNGFYKGEDKDFSFSDTYNPVNFGGARFCDSRVWSMFNRVNKDMGRYFDYAKGANLSNRMPLYVKPDHKIELREAMNLMRDYFIGTELDMTKDIGAGPYNCGVRWRPMQWKYGNDEYVNERAISTQQTGFFFLSQLRSWLPNPIGGISWFGVDDTYNSVYTPFYCSINEVPHTYAVGNGSMMEFSDDAAFWVFNQVSNFAYTRHKDMLPDIQAVQKELETSYIEMVQIIDKAALEIYKNDPSAVAAYLTNFSVLQGNNTVHRWKQLYAHLFTKFMDGNIKVKDGNKLNPKVKQPGYSPEWYQNVVEKTGDRYKVIKNQ